MSKGTFFITTPIYYVNAAPHLGTAYTTIGADALSRFKRMDGYEVAFVGGMDEHGQKVAETAASKGMTPQQWCDSMEPTFLDAWELLDITYTDIVRTSSDRQTRTVQDFLSRVNDAGWLYTSSYEGWYCVHEETYYAESDLERNDEGQFVCPDCKRPVRYESGGEENWFFKLSAFQDRLLAFYDEHPDFIQPQTRRNEIVSFVKSGLKDLSISRSTFDWGIPFPFDSDHVASVWFDALLAYLTGIGYADPDREGEWERFWPAAYHFVGQDITRFHCVIWPAMLMAAGMPVPEHVFGHGFLLTKGEKMSKSKGNGVMPADLVRIFGVDAYRYYFLSDVQFGHDGDISLERMVQVYNADLANTWGNLCSRVFNMTGKYFDGHVPAAPDGAQDNPLADVANTLYADYAACMDKVDFTGATAAVNKLAQAANLYVENTAPWNLAKEESRAEELAAVMYNLLEACRIVALFMAPFMPNTSQEVYNRLGLGSLVDVTDIEGASCWGGLPSGNAVVTGDPLFPRLDVDAIDLALE
ncbi:MAG: methionine--tRNA ligase [Eggerthellaceae bacterium]|nr:methionine--tRNA ligase [Eggerthellaceae bacterium]